VKKVTIGIALVLISGCGLAEIRKERATVSQVAESVAMKVLDRAKLDQTTVGAEGSVHNPAYRYEFFGGTGFFTSGIIQAVGVDLEGRVGGAGSGVAEPDADLRERIFDILQRDDLGREERKARVFDLIEEYLKLRGTATQPAG